MVWVLGCKGESGFSANSTAEEVTQGVDGTGLTAIVTGATSGLGAEIARVFALRGVHVVMAVRNLEAAKKVKGSIVKKIPNAKLDIMELDVSSQASVRSFASEYISSGLPLNILVHNAGIMGVPFTLTKDNIESQFATNHLGPFLLTNLLLDTMKTTAHKSGKEGRIILTSSEMYSMTYKGGILFDKLNDKKSYSTIGAYGQSKLATILHANELARRFKQEGVNITANALHPGVIPTNLARHSTVMAVIFNVILKAILKTIPQGAATSCYLALNPKVAGISGQYFADSNIAKTNKMAKDQELAKKLWDFSLSLTNPK